MCKKEFFAPTDEGKAVIAKARADTTSGAPHRLRYPDNVESFFCFVLFCFFFESTLFWLAKPAFRRNNGTFTLEAFIFGNFLKSFYRKLCNLHLKTGIRKTGGEKPLF